MSTIATWLLVLYLDGVVYVPMQSREACIVAATKYNKESRLYASCLNMENGAVILRSDMK